MQNKTLMKTPENNGKQWSNEDLNKLKKLVKQNTPTPLIAYELGRTPGSIQNKANSENISLKPTNKSPYNRQKK